MASQRSKIKTNPCRSDFESSKTDQEVHGFNLGEQIRGGQIFVQEFPQRSTEQKIFRMDKRLFYKVLSDVEAHLKPCTTFPNYRALDAEKILAMTLYYLNNTGLLSMTANSFGVATNTASLVIYQVCHVICSILGPKYVFLPKIKSEMMEKVGEFEAKFGMPQAFGCIDGTHVKIKRPIENS